MIRVLDFHYERPESWYGYEMDIPDDLFEDGREDDLSEYILDHAPIGEVYVEDWDLTD